MYIKLACKPTVIHPCTGYNPVLIDTLTFLHLLLISFGGIDVTATCRFIAGDPKNMGCAVGGSFVGVSLRKPVLF